jgi:Reverse transcriptase (RNA-dependent DNA polymerase)
MGGLASCLGRRETKFPLSYGDYKLYLMKELPPEPLTYAEAISIKESQEWQKAIEEKLTAHEDNGTWTIVPTPTNCKLIRNKWIFKRKCDNEGRLMKYKARLVAKGFNEKKLTMIKFLRLWLDQQ